MKAFEQTAQPIQGVPVWPLSVEAYHALGESGMIPENTELLYGFVYRKMSKSPLHSYLVQFLLDALIPVAAGRFVIRTEQPITCADSEPEPDVAVVGGRKEDYRNAHPRTAELVIEVCVSSHDYDRSKLRAYAAAGVKECWLVLAPERQVERHVEPGGDGFAKHSVHGPGEVLTSSAVPSFKLNLTEFLGGDMQR